MAFLGFLFIFCAAFFFYIAVTNLIAVIAYHAAIYFQGTIKVRFDKYQGYFAKGFAIAVAFTLGCVFVWLIGVVNAFA